MIKLNIVAWHVWCTNIFQEIWLSQSHVVIGITQKHGVYSDLDQLQNHVSTLAVPLYLNSGNNDRVDASQPVNKEHSQNFPLNVPIAWNRSALLQST